MPALVEKSRRLTAYLDFLLQRQLPGRIRTITPPDARGCQLSLLTLGGSIPMLAWWPQAQWFREELARVAHHPWLDWIVPFRKKPQTKP